MLSERAGDKCFNFFCFESEPMLYCNIMHINVQCTFSHIYRKINSNTINFTAAASLKDCICVIMTRLRCSHVTTPCQNFVVEI